MRVKLKAFHVEYDAINVPPHSSARFTGRCSIAADYQRKTGQPFSPAIYYLLPHTHTLSTHFFARVLGGARDGAVLLNLGAFSGEAGGQTFDPPVELRGAEGLLFGCEYANPRATSVVWGFGADEMCELFGFADTSAFFQSRVNQRVFDGTEGGVLMFSGPCDNQVFAN